MAIHAKVGSPLATGFMPRHSLEPRTVIFSQPNIYAVLRARRGPEVVALVVKRISIDVIYLRDSR